jgi:hypothetical protein
VAGGWWLVAGGWWLVAGGWWLAMWITSANQPGGSSGVSLARTQSLKVR